MAVVIKYGKAVKDPAAIGLVKPALAEGRSRVAVSGTIAVANGDSANSKHYLARIPSHAIILPHSILYHGGITGLNDYDVGLELNGTLVDIDALADGLDLTAAGNKNPTAALVVATGIGKQLWEVAGLTRDPGVVYDVIGTMKAAATAAANLETFLFWAQK